VQASVRASRSHTRRVARIVGLLLAGVVATVLVPPGSARAQEVTGLLEPVTLVQGATALSGVDGRSNLSGSWGRGPEWVPGTTVTGRWVTESGTELARGTYYTATAADVGSYLTYEVTATSPTSDTQVARSAPVRVELASGESMINYSTDATYSPSGPAFLAEPRIPTSTPARAGELRTTYTWFRDGAALAGGGGDPGRPWSHRLSAADAGGRLTLRTTVTQPATGITATYVAAPTPPIGTWTVSATVYPAPLRVGESLSLDPRPTAAYPDVWVDDLFGRFTTTQQWYRNGAPIYGATRTDYTLTRLDMGKRISATVTFRSPGYTPRTVATAPTATMPGTWSTLSLSGDAYRDVAVREQGYLLTHNGFKGGIDWGGAQSARPSWGSTVTALAVGEMSGDGQEDFVMRDTGGNLWAYRTDDLEYAGALGRVRIGTGWNGMDRVLAGADFDNDRYGDVMARRRADGALLFYAGRGPLGLAPGRVVGTGFGNRRIVTVAGDMNRDGRADVYSLTASGNLYLHAGLGGGRIAAGVLVERGWGGYTAILRAGDLTGDGRADLLARDTSGWLWLYPGEGNGHLGSRRISNRVMDNNRTAFRLPSTIY
jgi:hypothetical protein